MVATIPQIIGKINPKLYAVNGSDLLKTYGSIDKIPAEKVKPKDVEFIYSYPDGVESGRGQTAKQTIVYDSTTETLEPIYFWLLDLMNDFGLGTQKLVDNFTSAPGSGHFGELGTRASVMQQQASKLLGDINTVLRSTLNIIYDLKEFKIRLQSYKDLKSKNEQTRQAATLSLKQIWLDKVDMQKGNSGIKAMALGQAGFQTLLDAFLVAKDAEHVEKHIDLNDRVKRIVKSRIVEFHTWLENSEEELKKRYDLERNYLRSQVNSLRLYSRWAKPYLKAAADLEQKDQGRSPDLVNTFNTILLELTLFGKHTLNPASLAADGTVPPKFSRYEGRSYHSCVLVDFKFRGLPQRINQGQHGQFVHGGRTEITFRAYSLNDDELAMMEQELEKSDLGDVLSLIEGTTTDSLERLQEDIDEFLDDSPKEEEKEEEKKSSEVNPFMALIGKTGKSEKKKEKKKEGKKEITSIKGDSRDEKEYLRKIAGVNATDVMFNLYDIYKKGHRMPSFA